MIFYMVSEPQGFPGRKNSIGILSLIIINQNRSKQKPNQNKNQSNQKISKTKTNQTKQYQKQNQTRIMIFMAQMEQHLFQLIQKYNKKIHI